MHFWHPPGDPPGGGKSAHFFGYLITLPVGTVWAIFSPPGTPPPGPPWRGHPLGSGLDGGLGQCLCGHLGLWSPAPGAASSRRAGRSGKGGGQATGTRWTALRPVGGTCAPEELLPQSKDGSPRRSVRYREGGGRLREPNAARRLEVPVRTGSAPQGTLDLAPSARSGATTP